MQPFQTYHYQLPSPIYSVGGTYPLPLQNLPAQLFGRLVHVAGIVYDNTFTPTYTTAPTVIGNNNLVVRADFFDGDILRFQGSYNILRALERLTSGGIRTADTKTNTASASARYLTRVLHLGPPEFAGFPSDYAIPIGMLQSGQINFNFGALTDMSADTTAITASIQVFAKLVILDEVRIPPLFQAMYQAFNATKSLIPGRALYNFIGILPSASNTFASTTTFSAGDLGNIRVDFGQGPLVNSIPAASLWRSYNDEWAKGSFNGIQGEPGGATDLNVQEPDPASNTALHSMPADLQPTVWQARQGRISKCFAAASQITVEWTGSKTAGQFLFTRHLSMNEALVKKYLTAAVGGAGLTPKGGSIKTLGKKPYPQPPNGPYREFMPLKVKV